MSTVIHLEDSSPGFASHVLLSWDEYTKLNGSVLGRPVLWVGEE